MKNKTLDHPDKFNKIIDVLIETIIVNKELNKNFMNKALKNLEDAKINFNKALTGQAEVFICRSGESIKKE